VYLYSADQWWEETFCWSKAFRHLCCEMTLWRGRLHTVTRIEVIFRYPDRVPLTHFVHRAKKGFSMWAWIFCWDFFATRIFRRCNEKVFEHRVGANLPPSDYEPGVLPLRHCTLVFMKHSVPCWDFPAVSVVPGSRFFRPYLVVTCRDFPAVSAVTGSRIFRPYL
jgi:hypothetical protein